MSEALKIVRQLPDTDLLAVLSPFGTLQSDEFRDELLAQGDGQYIGVVMIHFKLTGSIFMVDLEYAQAAGIQRCSQFFNEGTAAKQAFA